MKCKTCPVREFIHADLYCQDCRKRQNPGTTTYHATLDRDYYTAAINAILDLEVPNALSEDQKVLFAAEKLLSRFRVNLVPVVDDYGLNEILLKEMNR
jgi:lipase chaperone LimK